jgi:hypothetical protein
MRAVIEKLTDLKYFILDDIGADAKILGILLLGSCIGQAKAYFQQKERQEKTVEEGRLISEESCLRYDRAKKMFYYDKEKCRVEEGKEGEIFAVPKHLQDGLEGTLR